MSCCCSIQLPQLATECSINLTTSHCSMLAPVQTVPLQLLNGQADMSSEAWLAGPGCAAEAIDIIIAGPPRQALICNSSSSSNTGSSGALSRGLAACRAAAAMATGDGVRQCLTGPVTVLHLNHILPS